MSLWKFTFVFNGPSKEIGSYLITLILRISNVFRSTPWCPTLLSILSQFPHQPPRLHELANGIVKHNLGGQYGHNHPLELLPERGPPPAGTLTRYIQMDRGVYTRDKRGDIRLQDIRSTTKAGGGYPRRRNDRLKRCCIVCLCDNVRLDVAVDKYSTEENGEGRTSSDEHDFAVF